MKKGVLYVVSTPIGNLEDITMRAVRVLRDVDLIACEDTRRSRILLRRLGISNRMISLHRFSESRKIRAILDRLESGLEVALISDAGAPAVSDPGSRLIEAALKAGFHVSPVPGPSSITAALSASGMEGSTFVFAGFVPRKKDARRRFFEGLVTEDRTTVIFETPMRVKTSLAIASEVLGPRNLVLLRELTKIHEEIISGTAETILDDLEKRPSVKGEIVIVVEGCGKSRPEIDLTEAVTTLMAEGLSGKRLADEAHKRFHVKKGDAYERFLQMKDGGRYSDSRK